MRAAVYDETGPPDVLHLAEVPDPVLTPRGVLIRVEAISIEGGDTLNRLGGVMPARPHIVGYQCGGTIEAVGADVRSEEHTSELQSLLRISYAVFCLKNKNNLQTSKKNN